MSVASCRSAINMTLLAFAAERRAAARGCRWIAYLPPAGSTAANPPHAATEAQDVWTGRQTGNVSLHRPSRILCEQCQQYGWFYTIHTTFVKRHLSTIRELYSLSGGFEFTLKQQSASFNIDSWKGLKFSWSHNIFDDFGSYSLHMSGLVA